MTKCSMSCNRPAAVTRHACDALTSCRLPEACSSLQHIMELTLALTRAIHSARKSTFSLRENTDATLSASGDCHMLGAPRWWKLCCSSQCFVLQTSPLMAQAPMSAYAYAPLLLPCQLRPFCPDRQGPCAATYTAGNCPAATCLPLHLSSFTLPSGAERHAQYPMLSGAATHAGSSRHMAGRRATRVPEGRGARGESCTSACDARAP